MNVVKQIRTLGKWSREVGCKFFRHVILRKLKPSLNMPRQTFRVPEG
jgi:hypothetical protein